MLHERVYRVILMNTSKPSINIWLYTRFTTSMHLKQNENQDAIDFFLIINSITKTMNVTDD